jgi:hypothetical protein
MFFLMIMEIIAIVYENVKFCAIWKSLESFLDTNGLLPTFLHLHAYLLPRLHDDLTL